MASAGGPLESDTIRDFILPAVAAAGWSTEQISREYWLRAQRVASLGSVKRTLGDGFADIVLETIPGTPVE